VFDRRRSRAGAALFVVISQVKINMTNAYAGSLAWSNFFARLTHSHPGRVVWAGVQRADRRAADGARTCSGRWIRCWPVLATSPSRGSDAVVADLVINKPLGLSPAGIEFRRAYLYDINPVGVGAMLLAHRVVGGGLYACSAPQSAGDLGVHRAAAALVALRR
jgi:hypothetical protein